MLIINEKHVGILHEKGGFACAFYSDSVNFFGRSENNAFNIDWCNDGMHQRFK